MPITQDLKPTEFELTFDCVFEDCPAKTTFAWDNAAKKYPAQIRKEALRRIKKLHEEGKHERS